ncbi:MAG: transcription termination/antitermination protein NusG [Chloroflexaceae bacterium]|nr:transcription termination/antitermination protein NusG [Chloroflexaceae bacterium]
MASEQEEQTVQPSSSVHDTDLRWYVIHTYSGYENKVKQNLEHRIDSMEMRDQIFRVIVPTEEEIEIKNGQRHVVRRKIYPGYVLVQMQLTDDSWYVVRNTPGVTSFVGDGKNPVPLEDDEVKTILRQMEAEAPKVRVSYEVGQTVKITDGPFTDFEGVVDALDHEKGRVRVLVSFFGREAPIELDFLQVTRLVE